MGMFASSILSQSTVLVLVLMAASVEGKMSNPAGYFVMDYFSGGQCTGGVEQRSATALGTCVGAGLRGEPYGPDHYIYEMLDNSSVQVSLYVDSECTQFRQVYETIPLDSCSTAGSAVYYTYSAELPGLTVDNMVVDYIMYDESEVENLENCADDNRTVLMSAVYSDACIINCFNVSTWDYCRIETCMNDTATFEYYETASCGTAGGSMVKNTTCNDKITCFETNKKSDDSSNEDDDDKLSDGAIIGISLSCVFVALVMLVAYSKFEPGKSHDNKYQQEGTSLQKPLVEA